jgi:hypothetical protein
MTRPNPHHVLRVAQRLILRLEAGSPLASADLALIARHLESSGHFADYCRRQPKSGFYFDLVDSDSTIDHLRDLCDDLTLHIRRQRRNSSRLENP